MPTALQPSRRLIQRLRRRDLFTSVGAVTLQPALERSILSSASSVTAAPLPGAGAGAHALEERVRACLVQGRRESKGDGCLVDGRPACRRFFFF